MITFILVVLIVFPLLMLVFERLTGRNEEKLIQKIEKLEKRIWDLEDELEEKKTPFYRGKST